MEAFGLDVNLDDADVSHVVDVCGIVKYLDNDGVVTYQLFTSDNLNIVERIGMLRYGTLFTQQEMEAEWFSFAIGDEDDDD